jgi:lipopolysaccharide biosynthesis glycosyltransferase
MSLKNIITISATSNYKDYVYALLQSAKTNLLKETYHIVILTNGLEVPIMEKARRIAQDSFDLSFYNVNRYPDRNVLGGLLESPLYWRLIGPHIVGDAQRILHVDTDTLILEDFLELFSLDLESKTVAACIDYLPEVQDGISNWGQLGLNPHSPYFNAGLLLIDVAAYKKKNIMEKVVEIVRNNKEYMLARGKWPQNDQYGLNVALVDDWMILPAGYNYGSGLKNKPTRVKIVHFIGDGKPGALKCKPEFSEKFFEYLKKADSNFSNIS